MNIADICPVGSLAPLDELIKMFHEIKADLIAHGASFPLGVALMAARGIPPGK